MQGSGNNVIINRTSIPYETVPDDELAAIELAILTAENQIVVSSQSTTSSNPGKTNENNEKHRSTPRRKLQFDYLPDLPKEKSSEQILQPIVGDIEDMHPLLNASDIISPAALMSTSPVVAFRKWRRVSITDLTALEWCEKQVEFKLNLGKPESTSAMKAGVLRHAELEKELIETVEIKVNSKEESWALRLLGSVFRIRQLLNEGISREIYVVGFLEDCWVVGVIDELQLSKDGSEKILTIVDTKTRFRPKPPTTAQKRNSRLQLMLYKTLVDEVIKNGVPATKFYSHFSLNANEAFSPEFTHQLDLMLGGNQNRISTLSVALNMFVGAFLGLPTSRNVLRLRYEWQFDHSILGIDTFEYESDWANSQLHWLLQFWQGKRTANFVVEEELWKCKLCSFSNHCPYGSMVINDIHP